jgi:hypothetical protein
VTNYDVFKATLVIEFPDPNGAKTEETFVFWLPRGSTPYKQIFVYRWKQTSGIREVAGKSVEWFDASISEGWNSSLCLRDGDEYISPPGDPPPNLLSLAPSDMSEGELASFRPLRPETMLAIADLPAVPEARLLALAKG